MIFSACPAIPKTSLGQKVRAVREVLLGKSRKNLGALFYIDPTSLNLIEIDYFYIGRRGEKRAEDIYAKILNLF